MRMLTTWQRRRHQALEDAYHLAAAEASEALEEAAKSVDLGLDGDDGTGDEEAEQYHAMCFYKAYLKSISFLDDDERKGMEIFVRTGSGKTITLDGLSPADSIDKVNAKILNEKGFRLTFAGKHLENGRERIHD